MRKLFVNWLVAFTIFLLPLCLLFQVSKPTHAQIWPNSAITSNTIGIRTTGIPSPYSGPNAILSVDASVDGQAGIGVKVHETASYYPLYVVNQNDLFTFTLYNDGTGFEFGTPVGGDLKRVTKINNTAGVNPVLRIQNGENNYLISMQIGAISVGGNVISTKAVLQADSTTKGFLPPRMTTAQRDAVAPAAGDAGLMIFNTTTGKLNFWNGTAWEAVTSA